MSTHLGRSFSPKRWLSVMAFALASTAISCADDATSDATRPTAGNGGVQPGAGGGAGSARFPAAGGSVGSTVGGSAGRAAMGGSTGSSVGGSAGRAAMGGSVGWSVGGSATGGSAGSSVGGSDGRGATGGSAGASVAAWRPFSDECPWNTRIAPSPELDPDSATLIADFESSSQYGEHLDVNIDGYSIPLYWADAATPTYSVLADIGGEGWTGSNGFNATALMPIPAGATPDPQSDHHLLVVDRQRMMEWGCWNLVLSAGAWHGGLCATSDLRGTGVRVPANGNPTWYTSHGARACGFPLVAGLIRMEEIQAGRIDHALVVAYPHIRAGWYTPPASTAQAANGVGAQSDRGIPCGGRIQFDPSIDLDALGLTRSGRIILLALQEYGAYVGDYSGAISLYAENGADARAYWDSGVLDSYELNGLIDLASFRVLRLGTLYDNGNG